MRINQYHWVFNAWDKPGFSKIFQVVFLTKLAPFVDLETAAGRLLAGLVVVSRPPSFDPKSFTANLSEGIPGEIEPPTPPGGASRTQGTGRGGGAPGLRARGGR